MGNRHPSIVPYESLPAADGELVIAVGNDRQFVSLCAELGCAQLAADPRFATNSARVEHRDALLEALTPACASRTRAELAGALNAAGVPCGPVNDLQDAFAMAAALGVPAIVELASGSARSPARSPSTPRR